MFVSNYTDLPLVGILCPNVKPIINYYITSMKPFLRRLGVNYDQLSPFFKEFNSSDELWQVFDNCFSTAHENLSTSNNNMDCAPTNITNYGGDGCDSGGGVINYLNVQTITEAITLAINGEVGNDDFEEVVDQMEK